MAGALREIAALFSFEVDDSKLKQADKSVGDLVSKIKGLAVVAGAGFVLKGIDNLIERVANAGEEIRDTSVKLGVSAAELQAWRFAAKQAGTDVGAISTGFGLLQKNAVEAAGGSKEMAAAFKAVGVDVTGADGKIKGVNQLLLEVGDGLHNTENESTRTALAMKLLGRSGKEFKPLFEDGAAGVQKLFARFKELGGGITDDVIKQTDELKDKEDQLTASMEAAEATLASQLIPAKLKLVEVLTDMVIWLNKSPGAMKALGDGVKLLAFGMTALGTAMAIKLGAPFAAKTIDMIGKVKSGVVEFGKKASNVAYSGTWSKLGKSIKGAFLPMIKMAIIVEGFEKLWMITKDFVGYLEGKDSVIGDFIKQLGDIDTIFPAWKKFKDVVSEVMGWITAPVKLLGVIGGGEMEESDFIKRARAGVERLKESRKYAAPSTHAVEGAGGQKVIVRSGGSSAATPGQTWNGSVNVTVNGASDPNATGRTTKQAVKEAIKEANAENMRRAHASLVPQGGV